MIGTLGQRLTRVLGLATAGYGLGVIAAPKLLAEPCGLTRKDGSLPESARPPIIAVGVRDVATGLAMALTSGRAQQAAVVTRVVSDLGDAAVFGLANSDPRARTRVVAAAAGWAAVCAAAGVLARRPR